MDLIQAIIYGIVQGLTEFLPISSSGHLLVVPRIFGWSDPGAGFSAVIQIGTVAAVLIYFRTELLQIFGGWMRTLMYPRNGKQEGTTMGWAIIAGSVPIAVIGVLLESRIDTVFRSPLLVATMLVLVGSLMFVAEKLSKRERQLEDVRIVDGVFIGLWQVLALIPGASRSGATIAGGLLGGFDRATAAKFSFLLSVPSVLGAGIYKLLSDANSLSEAGFLPTLVATIVAFVTGYAAIGFLIKFLQTHSTLSFVVYRFALGALIFGLFARGLI